MYQAAEARSGVGVGPEAQAEGKTCCSPDGFAAVLCIFFASQRLSAFTFAGTLSCDCLAQCQVHQLKDERDMLKAPFSTTKSLSQGNF